MKVVSTKTHKITSQDRNIFKILDKYLPSMKENSVLAVTSKIVSICEGRIIKTDKINKDILIKREAEYYLPKSKSQYGFILTIKNGLLMPSAGIDESNASGHYISHPANSQKTANQIRRYLKKRFGIKKVGVIITDSRTVPLRWGTTGVALAHSGFSALNSYIGTPDIFGRKLKVTKANIMDGLAGAAVLVMGEGKEQTPLVLISDIPFVKFKNSDPSSKELAGLKISRSKDLFAPLLTSVKWLKDKP